MQTAHVRTTGGRTHSLRALVAAMFVTGFASSPLHAQPGMQGGLPCEIAAKDSIDPSTDAQIKAFLTKEIEQLRTAAPLQASKARDAVLAPLACQSVSIAFRLKYGEHAEPLLTPLVSNPDERIATNALRIAGRLRTTGALRPIDAGLVSTSAVVRFASSSAYRDLFSQLAIESFGFPESGIDRAMDKVAAALTAEQDPVVADGLVLALIEGPRAQASFRGKGASRAADALAKKIKSLRNAGGSIDELWSNVAFRGLDGARLTILEQIAAGTADKQAAFSAAMLGAQSLVLARDQFQNATPEGRVALARLVGGAESTMVIAHNSLTGQKVGEKGLQRAFDAASASGNISEFASAIDSWVGSGGLLTKPPYAANASDFAKSK